MPLGAFRGNPVYLSATETFRDCRKRQTDKARSTLFGFRLVESSHRRRLFARRESDFRNAYGHPTKLWKESSLVMGKGLAVFCLAHRFHIEVVNRHDTQFKRGGRWRIEGLE